MKKLIFTAAFAGAMFFSVGSANAQVYENSESETPYVEEQQTDYTQIQEQDLPQPVKEALTTDHPGATLSEVYSAEKDGVITYKLVVSTPEGEAKELYADTQGTWFKKDEKDSQ